MGQAKFSPYRTQVFSTVCTSAVEKVGYLQLIKSFFPVASIGSFLKGAKMSTLPLNWFSISQCVCFAAMSAPAPCPVYACEEGRPFLSVSVKAAHAVATKSDFPWFCL